MDPKDVGLKPRMIERVFQLVKEREATHTYTVSLAMLEVYKSKLEDLGWKIAEMRRRKLTKPVQDTSGPVTLNAPCVWCRTNCLRRLS